MGSTRRRSEERHVRFKFQRKTWSCVRGVILSFTRFPPLSPLAFRVVFVLRFGRLWRDMKAGRVGGRRGPCPLLLRSQGPRGPIAIACPRYDPPINRCRSGVGGFSWRSLRTVDQTAGTRQPDISGSRRLSVWGPVLARNSSSWYGPSAPVKVVPPSPAASTLTVLAGPGDFALRISRREYCQEQKIVMISLHRPSILPGKFRKDSLL